MAPDDTQGASPARSGELAPSLPPDATGTHPALDLRTLVTTGDTVIATRVVTELDTLPTGNLSEAARKLGISYKTMRYRARKFGLVAEIDCE